MRVLLISPYLPQRDGLASYTRHLVAELRTAGDEVAVVSVRPGPESLTSLRDNAFPVVRAWAPDVVHVQHTMAGFGAALAALWRLVSRLRAEGVPIVTTHHEVTRDLSRTGRPGRYYYRRVAALTDIVHVHTRDAAALQPGALVLPHPAAPLPPSTVSVDELRTRYGLGSRPVLLCFGFVQVDKGLDSAVRAAGLLGDVDLVVAGEVRGRPWVLKHYEWKDHRHLAGVRRLARELDVKLTHTGYVPSGEFRSWFALADVVLLPYRRAEQSGVAQLAVSAGARVLATPVGGLAEMFAGTPSLLAGSSPQDIADGVRRTLAGSTAVTPALDRSTYGTLRDLYPVIRSAV